MSVRDEMLAELAACRAEWEALLTELTPAQMTIPGVSGDWSVKDLLGHMAAYNRYVGAWMHSERTGLAPTPRELLDLDEMPAHTSAMTLEERNQAIAAQYANWSLDEVLAKWRAATDLAALGLSGLTDEELTTPGRFRWFPPVALTETLPNNTYAHDREHAAEVRRWLATRGI